MNNYKSLLVYIGKQKVGTLAKGNDHRILFEYDSGWLEEGFSISPFSLPLQRGVFAPKNYEPFEGLFGIFADSLPDGWGRLLVDRLISREGLNPREIDSINRLAIVGDSGMGALSYIPEIQLGKDFDHLHFDELAAACKKILDSDSVDDLDEIFRKGGSSGGARPKIFTRIDGEDWIVKFPSSWDREDIGEQEYQYSLCAKRCGIKMPETRLISSQNCSGYFAVKRFDREGCKRIHMASVSALLETSHRIPNLDYNILMQLTLQLCHSYDEIEKLFRLMCFNVFAHNRDDHSKNFTYQCEDRKWCLSPAYDLTYSNSIGGEHATTVNGNGKNPDMKDLLAVAAAIDFDKGRAREIAEFIRETVYKDLNKWL